MKLLVKAACKLLDFYDQIFFEWLTLSTRSDYTMHICLYHLIVRFNVEGRESFLWVEMDLVNK